VRVSNFFAWPVRPVGANGLSTDGLGDDGLRTGRRRATRRRLGLSTALTLALAALPLVLTTAAQAQMVNLGKPDTRPITGNDPTAFQADRVNYDRDHAIIAAEGHVQSWQNDHFLSADRVTFDRNSGVAAAYGHVTIVEPDGQVVFAEYAELSGGMKQGVMRGMRALLADGGKLAANGARRTDGKLNELSRAVYTSCDLCLLDPSKPIEWQIRADHMVQDLENKRIEYSNAWLDIYGVPILYMPYMSSTDPSVRRQSGFLPPTLGATDEHLGTFIAIPYYWVINDQSDATIIPEITSTQGGQVQGIYRQRFNDGDVTLRGAVGEDQHSVGGYFFGKALFSYDDTWRYGANINVANSVDYLRDYQIDGFGGNFLGSNVFIEGFGVGSYLKLDGSGFQVLNGPVAQATLPYVLPRFEYSYVSEPNLLGGRVSLDTEDFNILRPQGTSDQRLAGRVQYDRPFQGYLGEQYLVTAQLSGAYYRATVFQDQPNYGPDSNASAGLGQGQLALRVNWPFMRDAGSLGTQIVEPIVQVIAAPQSGNAQRDKLPNEDSLSYEFTDSTLFSLNRFGGYDRYDGGLRANVALHGNWTFLGHQQLDAIIGASAVQHQAANLFPQFDTLTGVTPGKHLSDVVGRVAFVPNKWLDFTARGVVDHSTGNLHYGEAATSFGQPILRASLNYFYASSNPFLEYTGDFYTDGALNQTVPRTYYFHPRQELGSTISTHVGHYTATIFARADTESGELATMGGDAKYEDECTIFDIHFLRRYTSINGDHGNTAILFTITFKTVGQIGFTG